MELREQYADAMMSDAPPAEPTAKRFEWLRQRTTETHAMDAFGVISLRYGIDGWAQRIGEDRETVKQNVEKALDDVDEARQAERQRYRERCDRLISQ